MTRLSLSLALLALAGCPSTSGTTVDAAAGSPDLGPTNAAVIARPYDYTVPAGYDAATPTPLVIVLHGYSASGYIQDAYFGMSRYAEEKKFLVAFPDGTKDPDKKLFWNATDACCDFFGSGVDDVAYLAAVLDDMSARFNVDKKRVYLIGHSNGAFMSHRMACELAPRIAGIVALAGDNWKDTTRCKPAATVAVLQIHGDADATVPYAGASNYPSAEGSIGSWVTLNGCGATPETLAPLDLDKAVAGSETRVQRWSGCKAGGAAELWTIQGGGHLPVLQPEWAATVYGFLAAHPKP